MMGRLFKSFVTLTVLLTLSQTAECYDPLDPNGNITIKWDIMSWTPDGYIATVTIFNWQEYRHISSPGWKLGWEWRMKEVIWAMVGAQATSQGDCSTYHSDPIPHSCAPNPKVVDLLPGVPYNQQVSNCCRGGEISSYAQDPETALSSFQITVGNAGMSNTSVALPVDFTLQTPGSGYSCGPATKVPPANSLLQTKEDLLKLSVKEKRRKHAHYAASIANVSSKGQKDRETCLHHRGTWKYHRMQVTWNITCTYIQNLAQRAPTCCVSFSTFYNSTIIPCAECACACESNSTVAPLSGAAKSPQTCIDPNTKYDDLPAISTGVNTPVNQPDVLYCTRDMCPVKIHWHIKTNYKEYWRVKVTITNRDFSRNFTHWTLTLQHPNFSNFTEAFSFNFKRLNPYGLYSNDSAVFWGIKYFNDMLMQAGPAGNVQSELLFGKGKDFKLNEGWGFPHRVYFNGDDCVLPDPQDYPTLPNTSPSLHLSLPILVTTMAATGLSLIAFL